ncbi:hypothetical protein [Rhizobium yanglingense]
MAFHLIRQMRHQRARAARRSHRCPNVTGIDEERVDAKPFGHEPPPTVP